MVSTFDIVAGEGARLKRQQLEREICAVQDETLRSNLLHTFSKLFMFLEDDLQIALKIAANNPISRTPEAKGVCPEGESRGKQGVGGDENGRLERHGNSQWREYPDYRVSMSFRSGIDRWG